MKHSFGCWHKSSSGIVYDFYNLSYTESETYSFYRYLGLKLDTALSNFTFFSEYDYHVKIRIEPSVEKWNS